MTLNDLIQTERTAARAFNSARNFANPSDCAAMQRADFLLMEVRHFAQCWEEARHANDQGNQEVFTEARRAEMIDRLISNCIPSRL